MQTTTTTSPAADQPTPPAVLSLLTSWRLHLNDVRRDLELAESEMTGHVREIVNEIGIAEDQLAGCSRLLTLAREVLSAERDEVHDSPSAAAQWGAEWAENNDAPQGFTEADFDAAIALLEGMIATQTAQATDPATPVALTPTELMQLSNVVIRYIDEEMDGDGLTVTDNLAEEHGITITEGVIEQLERLGYKLIKA